jgi:hypothetical protein
MSIIIVKFRGKLRPINLAWNETLTILWEGNLFAQNPLNPIRESMVLVIHMRVNLITK